jgi:predicted lipoprotein with Yx(FWY)xxD motif
MSRSRKAAAAACIAVAAGLSACTTARVYSGPGGLYTDEAGRELFFYRYGAAEAQRFPCAAECSPAWTPLYAGYYDVAHGDYAIMVRADGNWQWAYRGRPIYVYSGRMLALAQDPQMRSGLWAPLTSNP